MEDYIFGAFCGALLGFFVAFCIAGVFQEIIRRVYYRFFAPKIEILSSEDMEKIVRLNNLNK